jgi:hypothetical protein
MNETVKKERLKPSIAHANLRDAIIQKYEEESIEALMRLPKKRSELQTFSRKRRLTQPKDFDPLNPPEGLYVNLYYFHL